MLLPFVLYVVWRFYKTVSLVYYLEMAFRRRLNRESREALEEVQRMRAVYEAAYERLRVLTAAAVREHGVSVYAAAEYAGVSRPTVYAWIKSIYGDQPHLEEAQEQPDEPPPPILVTAGTLPE